VDVLTRNAVTLAGRPDGRPLVFAHGFGCDQGMWRFVAPAFADTHRIVLFDHVGAGRSDLSAYSPTSLGAMTSCLHSSTSDGVRTLSRSERLSDRKVVRAKRRAMAGSVRQKLLVSSSPSSGRSGTPMMTGAMWADQPR
jgi:sigma-B regulation protein RsbQ